MGKVIKIVSKGNLGFGPQEERFSNYTRGFCDSYVESVYSFKSEEASDYAKIALRNRYLGELRERYGLKSIPFVWEEDKRPIIVQEPRVLQNISEFFWELIQKAKEHPEHHYILDSTLGAYDVDGFLEVKDEETLDKIMDGSREAVRNAEREYNNLVKARRTGELREIGLPVMKAINEYKNKIFRENPERVINLVKKNGLELEYVGEDAKNNLQVVVEAIKENPEAVKFAGKRLLRNPKTAIQLVRETGLACSVLDDGLKNNETILAEALLGYIDRGGKLTDVTGYEDYYYDDEPPFWCSTELSYIIGANSKLIKGNIEREDIYESGKYGELLSEETKQYLEGLLEKYKRENKETHDISEVAEAVNGVALDEYNATARETRKMMEHKGKVLKHNDDGQII